MKHGNTGKKREVTDKMVVANRQNALRSTGPKTEEGKRASSSNATKHGLDSSAVLIRGFECPDEWETHLEDIRHSLGPVGHLETTLADRIALYLWRLRRVAAAAAQTVAASPVEKNPADNTMWRESAALLLASEEPDEGEESSEAFDKLGIVKHSYPVYTARNAEVILAALARDAFGAVEGWRISAVAERVFSSFGESVPDVWEGYEYNSGEDPDRSWERIEATATGLGATVEALLATVKERCIATVPAEWAMLERRRKAMLGHFEHEAVRHTLPSQDLIDRVTKYEAHLERQLTSSLRNFYAAQGARLASTR